MDMFLRLRPANLWLALLRLGLFLLPVPEEAPSLFQPGALNLFAVHLDIDMLLQGGCQRKTGIIRLYRESLMRPFNQDKGFDLAGMVVQERFHGI